MPSPRVIIVETDPAVSNSLRASLRNSGQPFTIIDTPSGEEALLELSRGGVDLLVTDLELPGISGIELLERLRAQDPSAHSIVVTANPTQEAQSRAHALGVIAFLRKPIRTSHFLEAVSRALQLKGSNGGAATEEEKQFVAEWLMSMQHELGAQATFLLDNGGNIIVEAGELSEVDLRSALPALMDAFKAGLEISELLETDVPANFMYFDGERYDFYLATAGADHALVIVFKAKSEAKQIGAVIQYCRKAANDLVSGLYSVGEVNMSASNSGSSGAGEKAPAGGDRSQADRAKSAGSTSAATQDLTEQQPKQAVSGQDLESAADSLKKQDAESFWDKATEKSRDTGPIDESTLSYDEAQKRGLLDEEEE
jgi:DNA-binding NarL/FixJ family response regulator